MNYSIINLQLYLTMWYISGLSYLFPIHFNVCHIVLKHSGDVDFRELVFTEDYKKTGLPTSTIPNYHKLLPDGCHLWKKKTKQNKFIPRRYSTKSPPCTNNTPKQHFTHSVRLLKQGESVYGTTASLMYGVFHQQFLLLSRSNVNTHNVGKAGRQPSLWVISTFKYPNVRLS